MTEIIKDIFGQDNVFSKFEFLCFMYMPKKYFSARFKFIIVIFKRATAKKN